MAEALRTGFGGGSPGWRFLAPCKDLVPGTRLLLVLMCARQQCQSDVVARLGLGLCSGKRVDASAPGAQRGTFQKLAGDTLNEASWLCTLLIDRHAILLQPSKLGNAFTHFEGPICRAAL
jgi:hypothetical protein